VAVVVEEERLQVVVLQASAAVMAVAVAQVLVAPDPLVPAFRPHKVLQHDLLIMLVEVEEIVLLHLVVVAEELQL
jgi:hypothetical protein